MKAYALIPLSLGLIMALAGCATAAPGLKGVDGFDKTKYLGAWYEIARFDFVFEKGLDNTMAEYSPAKDLRYISVRNSGTEIATGKRKVALGRARFRGPETAGELEVSFFGPFWAEYTVLALDGEYRYALIGGKDKRYLWILSRTPTIQEAVKNEYVAIAGSLGFETEKLLWVSQSPK